MNIDREKFFSDWINQDKNKSAHESRVILDLISKDRPSKPKLRLVSSLYVAS